MTYIEREALIADLKQQLQHPHISDYERLRIEVKIMELRLTDIVETINNVINERKRKNGN